MCSKSSRQSSTKTESPRVESLRAKAEKAAQVIGSFKGVECVFLFGSVARGEVTPTSDIDLGVVLGQQQNEGEALTKLDIYTALAKAGYDSGVDVVIVPHKNVLLRHEVAHYNDVLYQTPDFPRTDYIVTALRDYEAHQSLFAIKRMYTKERLRGDST